MRRPDRRQLHVRRARSSDQHRLVEELRGLDAGADLDLAALLDVDVLLAVDVVAETEADSVGASGDVGAELADGLCRLIGRLCSVQLDRRVRVDRARLEAAMPRRERLPGGGD